MRTGDPYESSFVYVLLAKLVMIQAIPVPGRAQYMLRGIRMAYHLNRADQLPEDYTCDHDFVTLKDRCDVRVDNTGTEGCRNRATRYQAVIFEDATR